MGPLKNLLGCRPRREAGSQPRLRPPNHRHPEGEDGVVLVLWVMALTLLMGCLALSISLGNLTQSSSDIGNAADAAAISASEQLGADLSSPSFVQGDVTIPCTKTAPSGRCTRSDCSLSGDRLSCTSYDWLDQLYMYDATRPAGADCTSADCAGWWEIVPSASQSGQIGAEDALADGTGPGPWDCSQIFTPRHSQTLYCMQLSTNVSINNASIDDQPSGFDWALSDGAAAKATEAAVAQIEQTYAVDADLSSSTCADAFPTGFTLAEAWAGDNCLAYRLSEVPQSDPTQYDDIFWVDLVTTTGIGAGQSFFVGDGITSVQRRAWASSALKGLCSGMPPTVPNGNCY